MIFGPRRFGEGCSQPVGLGFEGLDAFGLFGDEQVGVEELVGESDQEVEDALGHDISFRESCGAATPSDGRPRSGSAGLAVLAEGGPVGRLVVGLGDAAVR